MNGWFIPEWSKWLSLWMGNHESLTHKIRSETQFIHEWNTAAFAFRDVQRSAVTLFGTIFVDDRVKSCSTCLLICCIKPISHLQTPLIIKSCHSPYHRKWELASELSRHKSTCKYDTFRRNLREWVELLLISAIKFCSMFSANNQTVNDASSVTMLSVRSCSRGADDFYRTVRECAFAPLQALITSPSAGGIHLVFP